MKARTYAGIVAAGVAAAMGGGYAYAANWPTSQIFGKTIVAGADPREVALTFDDGPNEKFTPRLLDILARNEARATFFLLGEWVRKRPEIVRAIRSAGHLVGNHTMTHPFLLWQQSQRVRDELANCNHAIEDVIGEPVRFFRPPHGARSPGILRAARELGLTPVMWNITAYDWRAADSAQLAKRIEGGRGKLAARGSGANVLLHDGSQFDDPNLNREPTLAAVEALLASWKSMEIRLVTVDAWNHLRAEEPAADRGQAAIC